VPGDLTLYVCHIDEGGPKPHACRRAIAALQESGHDFEKVIYGKGIPFGLFTKGKRPELKEMSGQEKLPVLKLADGSTVNGGSNIVAWAKFHAPAPAPAPAPAAEG
jgi:glutathione S-transferase